MKSKQSLLLFLVGLVLLSLACSISRWQTNDTEVAVAVALTQTAVAQANITPTEAPVVVPSVTPEATPPDAESEVDLPLGPGEERSFDFEGITFAYNTNFITEAKGQKTPPYSDYDGFSEGGLFIFDELPDFTEVALITSNRAARLALQPIKDKAGSYYPGYAALDIEEFERLSSDVDNQAGNVYAAAQVQYLDFGNGSGRRKVFIAPSVDPAARLSNQRLYYVFEGLTAAGRNIVWFKYPLSISILPANPEEADPNLNEAKLYDQLNHPAETAFKPTLSELDAFIQQLQVQPPESQDQVVSSPTEQLPTLCQREEDIILTCSTKSDPKILSICASQDLTQNSGYLQYRFGTQREIELEFPKNKNNSAEAFLYVQRFLPQSIHNTLSFVTDNYTFDIYEIHTYSENTENYSYAEDKKLDVVAGVGVTAPNSDYTVFECVSPTKYNLASLKAVVPGNPISKEETSVTPSPTPTVEVSNLYVLEMGGQHRYEEPWGSDRGDPCRAWHNNDFDDNDPNYRGFNLELNLTNNSEEKVQDDWGQVLKFFTEGGKELKACYYEYPNMGPVPEGATSVTFFSVVPKDDYVNKAELKLNNQTLALCFDGKGNSFGCE